MFNTKVINYESGSQIRLYTSDVLSGDELKKFREERKKEEERKRALYLTRLKDSGVIPDFFSEEEFLSGNIRILDDDLNYEFVDNSEHYAYTACNRAKKAVYEYTRANIWEYFVTVTFKPSEDFDRYDYSSCYKLLSKWLNNIRSRKAPDIKYLFVPETHKDGAYHFHGVISDIGSLKLVDSHCKTSDGLIIYNLVDWDNGFTTCTKVKSSERVSHYVTKYITKDISQHLKGRQRYLVSQNLKRPTVTNLSLSNEERHAYIFSLDNITYHKKLNMPFNSVQYFENSGEA